MTSPTIAIACRVANLLGSWDEAVDQSDERLGSRCHPLENLVDDMRLQFVRWRCFDRRNTGFKRD